MLAAIFALVGVSSWFAPRPQEPARVPPALIAKLTRGVNIARWFCYVKPDDAAHFAGYLTDRDFENFRRLDVQFVRLCVSPSTIYRDGAPDPANLAYIDAAIGRLEKAGLAVLLDLHDTHGQMDLDMPSHDNAGFVRFWSAMARHFKGRGDTSTVFELLNEPRFRDNPDDWYALQSRTVDAVRAVDPARTIVVTSTRSDGIDTLLKMSPLPQGNLIYTVHCYDPFIFTHQGATWSTEQYKVMRDLPFPSSPEAVDAMINEIPEQFRTAAQAYGKRRYDAAKLRARLAQAVDWAAQNHVPLLLGEFGCYPPAAPPDARGRWFDAMREALGDLHLPNCLWGYDDALGLGRKPAADGSIKLDPLTIEHLYGLTSR